MRALLITILIFAFFISSAQIKQTKIFERTEYVNGNFYRQLHDTIKIANEKIDIYFLNHHFYWPYYLPEKFVDKQKKNQKISVWRDPKAKKDYQKNWKNTYTYDSLGRVTNYTYSGCFICSNMPYSYTVTYNLNGQVGRIINTTGTEDGFKFYYNGKGDLVKFEKYSSDKIEERITLIK